MSGLSVVRPWYRFRLNNVRYDLTGDVTQTEQLEAWQTTVADVELYDAPTLVRGAQVDIYQVKFDTAEMAPQFQGYLNNRLASSFPHQVSLRCQGPLHRLRRASQSGHNLTGMTDGEAVMYVLDGCNVPYDPDDIEDAGYVLGAEVDIFWQRDQIGWEVVEELDRVMGMSTIDIGAGRVVRFAYDRAPSSAHVTHTYTKGVDANFWGLDRSLWDLDSIQNIWHVTGATWQNAANCSLTPWARAEGPNDAFETDGVRVRKQPFQSDVIQDESLAEAVARRMMRWFNRDPDEITLVAENDITVHPGTVIGVKDPIYGIDLVSVADASPYLVLTVDRRGHEMTLRCVGGLGGPQGTVTHGVEKRCNKTVSDVNIPGDFTIPTIGIPPMIAIGGYDCFLDGGPGGVCPDEGGGGDPTCLDSFGSADGIWTHEGADWNVAGNSIFGQPGGNELATTTNRIPAVDGVPISYRVTFSTTTTGGGGVELSATDNDGDYPLHWFFTYLPTGYAVPNGVAFLDWCSFGGLCSSSASPDGVDWGDATPGALITVVIEWDRLDATFSVSVQGVPHTITGVESGTSGGLLIQAINRNLGPEDTVDVLDLVIELLEDPADLDAVCDPPAAICGIGDGTELAGSSGWVFSDGDWAVDPDTGAMTASGASAMAYFSSVPMTTGDDWEAELVFEAVFSNVPQRSETQMVELSVGSPSDLVERILLTADFDQVTPAEETSFVGPNDASCWTPSGIGTTNHYGGLAIYPIGGAITYTLAYDSATQTLTGTTSVAGSQAVSVGSCWASSSEPVYFIVRVPFSAAIAQDLITVTSFKILSATAECV